MLDRKEVLSRRVYKAGYVLQKERRYWDEGDGKEHSFVMSSAYTPTGDYIGGGEWGYQLVTKRGIKPEKAQPGHNVCSIGFSESRQKWYSWSHRAILGFKIGDSVKERDCAASSGWTDEYLAEHPEANTALPVGFTAQTLDDCRRMAVAFAESVS